MSYQKILIASIPRCGSTYLFRSIAGLKQGSTSPKDNYDLIKDKVKSYYIIKGDKKIYKTHLTYNWWEDYLDVDYDKVIFLYGNIHLAVISTYLNRFEKSHFSQCGYFGEKKDIFKQDFLGYTKMYSNWYNSPLKNKLFINYDNIPKRFQEIESFVGVDVKWNAWKVRNSDYSKITNKQLQDLVKTYPKYPVL